MCVQLYSKNRAAQWTLSGIDNSSPSTINVRQERPLGQRKTPPACISPFCDILITVEKQYWQIYV